MKCLCDAFQSIRERFLLKLCGVSGRKKRNEMIFVSRRVNSAPQKSFLGPAKPVLRIRAERLRVIASLPTAGVAIRFPAVLGYVEPKGRRYMGRRVNP